MSSNDSLSEPNLTHAKDQPVAGTAKWLELRERLDGRFRSRELTESWLRSLPPAPTIVDLGCGIGGNLRYLRAIEATVRKSERHYSECSSFSMINLIAVDCDSQCREHALNRRKLGGPCEPGKPSEPEDALQFRLVDLATELKSLPTGPQVAFTASAFLDLVSSEWLLRFLDHVGRTSMLFAATASGPMQWHPKHPHDHEIQQILEGYRRLDHGFGPALASSASQFLAQQLTARGDNVSLADSSWKLESQNLDDVSGIVTLIEGTVRRMQNVAPEFNVQNWQQTRLQQLSSAQLRATLPLQDLFSKPY